MKLAKEISMLRNENENNQGSIQNFESERRTLDEKIIKATRYNKNLKTQVDQIEIATEIQL